MVQSFIILLILDCLLLRTLLGLTLGKVCTKILEEYVGTPCCNGASKAFRGAAGKNFKRNI